MQFITNPVNVIIPYKCVSISLVLWFIHY